MANIYKRGNIWWAKVQKSGQIYRDSLRTTSRTVAKKRFKQWLEGLEAIEWGERPRRLFDDAAEKFVVEHCPTLRPSSAKRYFVSLKNLGKIFAGLTLDQITTAKLLDFEQMRRIEGASAPTIRRDLSCLSSMFSHCIEAEWCDANPVPAFMKRRRKMGLREAPPRTRYLSIDEETALLNHASDYVADAMRFAIDTGLRNEEQFSLTWRQIDLSAGYIHLSGSSTKNHHDRAVPILARQAQFLAHHPRNIRKPYVFCHNNGDRYRNMDKGLRAAARRADIKNLRWHDLRRTCGCRLLQEYNRTKDEVQIWLGHHSVTVTERSYAFLDIEKTKRAVTKMDTGSAD